MFKSKKNWLIFSLGLGSGLAFAPFFLFPLLFSLSYLAYQISIVPSYRQAFTLGFIYGFGYFLTGIYWITFGVGVYIEEFWWLMPFSLLGLPAILACFIAFGCLVSYYFKGSKNFRVIFCLSWIFFEWLRSWIFTGLPWNLLSYSLAFSNILVQILDIFGSFSLSLVVIYCASSFYDYFKSNQVALKNSVTSSIVLSLLIIIYGAAKLYYNPTSFSTIKARIVQPSIKQIAKWDPKIFWDNLNLNIKLSKNFDKVDMIIWSESALTVPYNKYQSVFQEIQKLQNLTKAILVTGSISEDFEGENLNKIYTNMVAIDANTNLIFEYHKIHLVPFGEYVPFKKFIPFKKITAGFIDYSAGKTKTVAIIEPFKLNIKPLICYEAVFPDLALSDNHSTDLFINITNDAWFGKSSGPYQHFHTARMRAIENGIPLIRSANHGISAIIDPCGRVIHSIPLNVTGYFDNLIPNKLNYRTIYSILGNFSIFLAILMVILIQASVSSIFGFFRKK